MSCSFRINMLKKHKDDLQGQVQKLNQLIGDLEGELATLRNQLDAMGKENDMLKQDNLRLRDDNERIREVSGWDDTIIYTGQRYSSVKMNSYKQHIELWKLAISNTT